MDLKEILTRIGFAIFWLTAMAVSTILFIFQIKALETIIGDYIIVVLLAIIIISIQFLYPYKEN